LYSINKKGNNVISIYYYGSILLWPIW